MIKELKPVNEACLFKNILVSTDNKNWEISIFCGFMEFSNSGYSYLVLSTDNHDNTVYGYDSNESYKYAKRCADVIYGDEDD